MEKPVMAKKGPYETQVQKGQTYFWCSCGKSADQPLCDGSHQGSRFEPIPFTADKTETVYLCGCKQSKNKPHCDGTHNDL